MSTRKTPKTTETATTTRRAPRKKADSTGSAAPKARKAAPKKATPKAAAKKSAAKAAPKKAAAKPATPSPKGPTGPTHEQIAARAAEIWRETGGLPFDNWIRAERELAG